MFMVVLSIFFSVLHLQKYYFLSESGWFGLFLFLCKVKNQQKMNKFTKAILIIVAAIIVVGCTKDSYQGREYVDLGLPSGTLWATCN